MINYMKSKVLLLFITVMPLALMAKEEGDTVSKWWSRLSVEANMGVMYTNDIWPPYEEWESLYSLSNEANVEQFGWEGRSCSVTLGYDLTERWLLGIGVSARKRGVFSWKDSVGGGYGVITKDMPIREWLKPNWRGSVLNLPVTVEYHQKWFYLRGGIVVECGLPLQGADCLLPPPYGRSGSTIMKWWHGGAVVSLGGRFQLSRHSIIKVGFEARVVVTPYAYYAEDWVGVPPSDRHYRLYANQNYGVTVGYVYHF